jgi:hypothetical protein
MPYRAQLGFLSLSFRQTNILWVAFVAFISIDVALKRKFPARDLAKREDLQYARLGRSPESCLHVIKLKLPFS